AQRSARDGGWPPRSWAPPAWPHRRRGEDGASGRSWGRRLRRRTRECKGRESAPLGFRNEIVDGPPVEGALGELSDFGICIEARGEAQGRKALRLAPPGERFDDREPHGPVRFERVGPGQARRNVGHEAVS